MSQYSFHKDDLSCGEKLQKAAKIRAIWLFYNSTRSPSVFGFLQNPLFLDLTCSWHWERMIATWILLHHVALKIGLPSLPGFEPGIFWSVVRRVIHCATSPGTKGEIGPKNAFLLKQFKRVQKHDILALFWLYWVLKSVKGECHFMVPNETSIPLCQMNTKMFHLGAISMIASAI